MQLCYFLPLTTTPYQNAYSNLAKLTGSTVKQRKTTSIQVQKILKINSSTIWSYREIRNKCLK